MTHHYLFALSDAGGTVPPELGVVRRLAARGHRVRVLGEDSMAAETRATGAEFEGWRAAPNRPGRGREHDFRDWETANPLRLARAMADDMLAGPAAGYAADTAAAIDADRPDLVVTSFVALGAMIAAEARGIGFDVMIPNIYPMPAKGMPPMGMGLRPAAGPIGRLRDRGLDALATRVLGRYALPRVNAARRDHGLAPVRTIWEQTGRARRVLVMTSPAFDFAAELPPRVRYVGPILDDPDWAADADWTRPSGEGPLALVAMSSTFQNQTAALQRVVDALAGEGVRGLVTTGPALEPAELTPAPSVEIVASAPHHRVLREASLVVTHGGHGTVVKALAAGVPLLLLPHGRDQPDNAARVAQRGAGLTLPRTASTARIRAGLRAILTDPGYATAAARLGAAIRRDAASTAIVDELERITPPGPESRRSGR